MTYQKAVKDADLIVIATPVGSFERCDQADDAGSKQAIVTDVGSVKGRPGQQDRRPASKGVFFVGGHPIAGKDREKLIATMSATMIASVG